MPAMLVSSAPLVYSCLLLLLHRVAATTPPSPLDTFRIFPPPPHLITDVDTPELVLQDAWAASNSGRFGPTPGLLPPARVALKFSRFRADELLRSSQALAHDAQIRVTLFVQTCMRLLEDLPVLPISLTPIGAHPISFFPASLAPDDVDVDSSICFSSAELPLEAVLDQDMTMRCNGNSDADMCEVSNAQLQRLHLSATIDNDPETAPALLLHRIYSSRSTLYARLSVESSYETAPVQSVLLHSVGSLVIYRNTIPFAYLVQSEGWFNASHLVHQQSVALHVQWKYNVSSNDSFFLPNSSQNDGRNALWTEIRLRHPLTRFLYYIFMDEDVKLLVDLGRSTLHCGNCGPHQLFEQYLVQYQPAVAFPRFPLWHQDDGSEVQLLHTNFNFDHILIAIRAEAATMFLPTETRFDSECWWLGQSIWAMVARAFYHEHTIQVNSITTHSTQNRPLEDSIAPSPTPHSGGGTPPNTSNTTASVVGKKYMRCQRFHPAFSWFMSSIKDDKLLLSLSYSSFTHQLYDSRMLLHMGSRFVAPPDAPPLYPPPPLPPPPLPSAPRSDFNVDLRLVDCCHPYWRQHGLTWQQVDSEGVLEWSATGCAWEKNWMRQQCFTHAPYEGADASDLYRIIQYQYRLIKEGAEPQIAHLQRSVLQQEQHIASLLAEQGRMQKRLEALERSTTNNK